MSGSLPVWLLDSKAEITGSHQWPSFLQDLEECLEQELIKSHKGNFYTLSDAEKALFVERATKAVKQGQSYAALYKKVSSTLDRRLNSEVQHQLNDGQISDSKTDLILGTAQDGIIGLLKKWPNLKSKLHVCFCQSFSEAMRPVVWRLCLANDAVGRNFRQILYQNPQDRCNNSTISNRCREVLNQEAAAESVKSLTGAHYAMTTVLSYFHSQQNRHGDGGTIDINYKLILPFIIANIASLPRRERPTVETITHIAEEYLTFINSMPNFDFGANQKRNESFKTFASRVAHHLQQINLNAVQAISSAYLKSDEVGEAGVGYAGQSHITDKETLTIALEIICKPIIYNLFIGFVNREVLLFLWDQCVIGIVSPGFSDEFLPAITALFLHLLSDERIKKCNSLRMIEDHLRSDGPRLTVTHFQFEIRKHFYTELQDRLRGGESTEAFAEISDKGSQWQNWFSHQVAVDYTSPEDKQAAREEREVEKRRVIQAELNQQRRTYEEKIRKQEEDYKQQVNRERWMAQQNRDKDRREIERLKRELAAKEQERKAANDRRKAASTTNIAGSVKPKPPLTTRESHGTLPRLPASNFSTVSAAEAKPLKVSAPEHSRDIVADLIQRMAFSFNKIVNGEGVERERLDRETLESIKQHSEDVREAQIKVLGSEMSEEEFKHLPEEERKAKADQILDEIHRRVQIRYQESLQLSTK